MPVTRETLIAAVPDMRTPVALPGLEALVTVWRDPQGIPHARARTAHDAFFAQGFMTSQDRLWQMEYDRRRACGRWAECAGHSALAGDLLFRCFRLEASARADYEAADAGARAMLDAYAAGVNAFIEQGRLPAEYEMVGAEPEPWQPWDGLAVFKVRHINMGTYDAKLWRARVLKALGPERAARLFPGYQPGHLVIVPPGATYQGPELDARPYFDQAMEWLEWLDGGGGNGDVDGESNSWVLHGGRTASGKPLLAGDSHRPLDVPNVYYQNHIACDEFDVIGLSFPGFPGFPHFGHNGRVAWCVTHATADYQDLYVERFDPSDPSRYECEGQWRSAEVRHETVQVRDGTPVELDVTLTHHGPVIAGNPAEGYGLAFCYTGTVDAHANPECARRMLAAPTVAEMDEAMRGWVDPCNNLLMADVDGNIAYLVRGTLPVRAMSNAWTPVPGWTGLHEWKGEVPFEELPRLRNPGCGYIVTANNRITGAEYPYYVNLDFAPEFRARRVLDRVSGLGNATVADMASVHADALSAPAVRYLKLLGGVDAPDAISGRAKEALMGWDGSMERESPAATIYSAFRRALDARLARVVLGSLADEALGVTGGASLGHLRRLSDLFLRAGEAGDVSWLPHGTTWRVVLGEALAEATSHLRERLGDDVSSWTWERVHRTAPRHTLSETFPEDAGMLDPPSVPLGGDFDTVLRGAFPHARPFDILGGLSVARYVFDLADWERSGWVVPLGVSGHLGSAHYADQAEAWSAVQLAPMRYDWERIAREAESQQALSPDS